MSASVSVIMPTYGRPDRHESAYTSFAKSAYPFREMLVYDDSPEQSTFFTSLRDPRVRYFYSPERLTIGAKRNALIKLARGAVIAHQDDDDVYAPAYLGEMIKRLNGDDLVKLSVFNVFDERDGSRWRWDTRGGSLGRILGAKLSVKIPFLSSFTTDAAIETVRWGYGFSYMYRRTLCTVRGVWFPDINLREDYEFIVRARRVGAKMKQIDDCADLVWHTVHDRSTSASFPQTRLAGPAPRSTTSGALAAFAGYIENSSSRH